jgi:hypothetical protein
MTPGAPPPGRRRRPRASPAPAPSEAEIEREIGDARARIGTTLDALACRLAPRRLLGQGSEILARYLSASAPNRHLERLGLGLIGAGVAAIVVANRGLLRRREASDTDAAEDDEEIRDDDDREPSDPAGPLLFALLGFAAGAAVALLLPPGGREQRAIAEAREDLWRRAEALGHELAARIRGLGRDAAAAHAPPPVREGEER